MSELDFVNGNAQLLQWLVVAVVAFAASIFGSFDRLDSSLTVAGLLTGGVGVLWRAWH